MISKTAPKKMSRSALQKRIEAAEGTVRLMDSNMIGVHESSAWRDDVEATLVSLRGELTRRWNERAR